MPHLDEGMLHAHLDNEHANAESDNAEVQSDSIAVHLSECAECRAALEDAREVKAAAEKILAAASPKGISMPSFADLEARAESVNHAAGKQRDRFSQMRTLAWAATIVLAVAVGWYARSAVLSSRQDAVVSESETSGRLAIQVPRTDSAGTEETREAVADVQVEAQQDGTPEDSRLEQTLDVGGVPSSETEPDAVSEVGQTRVEAEEPKGRADVEAERAPTVAPLTVVTEETGANTAGAVSLQERYDAPETARVRRTVPEQSAPAPMLTGVAGGGARGEIDWVTIDAPSAEDILERPVPVIQGLPVVEFATATLNGLQAVRVIQSLRSGNEIHLTITNGEPLGGFAQDKKSTVRGALVADADAPSTNNHLVRRGGLTIILNAALSSDSLRVLGEKIPS